MIELKARKQRDEKRQIAFFTVDEYEFADGSVPVELDTDTKVLIWLEKNEDRYMFLILQKMYRNGDTWADWQRFKTDENTDLAAFQKWIADGCRNQIIVGYYKNGNPIYKYIVIEKQPWKSTHPPELKLTDKIDSLTVTPDLKSILKDIIMR